jgi:predicted N-acetyltransferase YhbS
MSSITASPDRANQRAMEITLEVPEDREDIERLLDVAFGAERAGKTVYRLRDGVDPVAELDTVIRENGTLKGSLRFWPIVIGALRAPALLLGPVAVAPEDRGKGYARALIWDGLERAGTLGYRIVLLVGDEPYYSQFGFTRSVTLKLELPGPVDLARFLGLELDAGALEGVEGMVQRAGPGEARPHRRLDGR